MDRLARLGLNGLLDPVEPGRACGSDTAHMSVFGYDPREHYRGRGAFESMGAGLHMEPGDIAFKCNFATLDRDRRIVISRRADRDFEGLGPVLCAAIDGIHLDDFPDYQVSVQYATEHRCGVRVRGPNLSDNITGTDPLKDNLPLVHCAPLDADDASAAHTSRLVNALSEAIERTLSAHPINAARVAAGKNAANCVLLRGCGRRLAVPTFAERHGGISAFMIAPTCIIAGLGLSVGIHVVRVDGATGDYRTDLSAKARAASDAIAHHDLGFIHVKAVDDAAHDRNIARRIEWLEKIDAELIAPIIDTARRAHERIAVIITGDHASPVIYGDHSCEPVPFVVCIDAARADDEESEHAAMRDAIDRFDEIEAARGALGRFCGDQVMGIVRQVVAL